MDKQHAARISADMTLLEILSDHPTTEAVFRSYDERAGVCICCEMLFASVHQLAEEYGLDLTKLLADLDAAATP